MNTDRRALFTAAAFCLCLLLALAGCGHVTFTHAPPGTSVNIARAKKAEPVPTPAPAAEAEHVTTAEQPSGQDALTENIADYYTLGNLMMEQQKYAEAIKAYENAVRLDPTFSDAWNHLAICYQNTGQTQKAADAFKKYKTASEQQQQQGASATSGQ